MVKRLPSWDKPKKYSGKLFSILSDSLGTFEGYNPKCYPIHYKSNIRKESGVADVNDTWWMQVIHFLDGELCVNDSYAGSCVAGCTSASGSAGARRNRLKRLNKEPDVILVSMGTNDFGRNYPINSVLPFRSFSRSYDRMIKKLKQQYPKAEIWTIGVYSTHTIVERKREAGIDIRKYNQCIDRISQDNHIRYIEGIVLEDRDTHDHLHPNRSGMRKIALHWINNMLEPN